jgi:hypothetical protein
VTVFLEGEEVIISSTRQAVARGQNIVRKYVAGDRKLSDELTRDRRAGVERE